MPKLLQYRAGSVIYFRGDLTEKIFLLQNGSIKLTYVNIETGQDTGELLSKGEFFGVKSALGHYPREETAVVVQNSMVMAFSIPEFEQLAMKNSQLIIKMLKVFSNQMRRTHKQVASLMNDAESQNKNPEEGLYQLGKFYFKKKKYAYARHVYSKYLAYYSKGIYADAVQTDLNAVVSFIARYGDGLSEKNTTGEISDESAVQIDGEGTAGTTGGKQGEKQSEKPMTDGVLENANLYGEAIRLIPQKNYIRACQLLKKLVDGDHPEFASKSSFEIGRCLFLMGKYTECIRYYTQMIAKYPKHDSLGETLFFMGQSYEKTDNKTQAVGFYKKSLAVINNKDDDIYINAARALKKLGS
ncbi:MAG: cyclic nucleotide-binding domain-containing protein [Treponema sp.]|jgi:TolA-binding protein|nr:cyclic nucleotide-binding domain-containing protein [Treponema sp.]